LTDKLERLGELDICFMVDETGSMGPYINTVKQKILEIIHNIRSKELCSSLRIAAVSYRDHPPEDNTFVTKVFKFNKNSEEIKQHILGMQASGGGDGPEAVSDAIYDVNRLYWREKAAKIVIWMGDAPPHGVEKKGDNFKKGCPDGKDWKKEAEYAYNRGILIYSVGCYPEISKYKKAEKVYKEIAEITKGKFVPLEKAHLLVSLITGVAEGELEKLKVEELVAQEMQQIMAASPSMSEEEIEDRVYTKLEEKGITLKSMAMYEAPSSAPVEAEHLELKKRKLKKDDIKEAMRQARLKKLVK